MYCPKCGDPIVRDGGAVRCMRGLELSQNHIDAACSSCGATIGEFAFELIEIHPHPDGKGGFR